MARWWSRALALLPLLIGPLAAAGQNVVDTSVYPPAIGALADRLIAECRAAGGTPDIVPDFIVAAGDIEPRRFYWIVLSGGVKCYAPGGSDRDLLEPRYCNGYLCTAWLYVGEGRGLRMAWQGRVVNIGPRETMGQFSLQYVYPCQGATCDVRHRWNGRTLVPVGRARR